MLFLSGYQWSAVGKLVKAGPEHCRAPSVLQAVNASFPPKSL